MMEGATEEDAIGEHIKVASEEVQGVLKKAWILISLFILGFGVPLLAITYMYTGSFWATYIRFWALAGMIFGFLLGIPTGMVIFGKTLFNKTKL